MKIDQQGFSNIELTIGLLIFALFSVFFKNILERHLTSDELNKIEIVELKHALGDSTMAIAIKNNSEISVYNTLLVCDIQKEKTQHYVSITLPDTIRSGETKRIIVKDIKEESMMRFPLVLNAFSHDNVPLFNAKSIRCTLGKSESVN